MKLKYFLLTFSLLFISLTSKVTAQDQKDDFKYNYITITKLHSSSLNIDFENWKSIEQEYFDKVTNKNNLIANHEILVNYNKDKNTEVIILNTYKSWDDIEKSRDLRKQLIKKAWPKEEDRYAFFEKQNKYFEYYYSNEIFVSTRNIKQINKEVKKSNKEPLFYYIVSNKLADYDYDDSLEAYNKYVNAVIYKNPYVKGYLTYKHYIGSDSRDFIQAYVVDSYADLQKSLDKDRELFEKMFTNKNEKETFLDIYHKGVEKTNDIGIYTNVPSMSK